MFLPPDIKQVFFNTLNEEMSIPAFEQWLYAEKGLEQILGPDDYLDLIAHPYKSANAKYGLYQLLEQYISKGEQETMLLDQQLTKALNRDKSLPELLTTFYDKYCKGYYFLQELGINYGLRINVPEGNSNKETWSDLMKEEQNTLIESFYPELEIALIKVISWLDSGKIILTGIRDENDRFDFIDNREATEK